MQNEFSRVYETTDPMEAEIVMQMLRENAVNAVSVNKRDSSYHAFGLIEIYCPANDVVTALHLINTTGQ
jgi:hypothetical protein